MDYTLYTPEVRKCFGRLVRLKREERQMSQRQLAESIGTTQGQISVIENGGNIEFDTMIKLDCELGLGMFSGLLTDESVNAWRAKTRVAERA